MHQTGQSPDPNATRYSTVRRLAKDPWVVASLSLTVLILALYVLPIFTPEQAVFLADYGFIVAWMAIAIGALLSGLRRFPNRSERRFWLSIAAALSFWALSEVIAATQIIDTGRIAGAVLIDCLYLLYYLGWLLALETCPHLEPERRSEKQLRRFSWFGRFLFVIGLFAYFVLIPTIVQVEVYTTWIPSFLFYVFIDLYFVGRIVFAFAGSESRRWKVLYALLGCAVFLVAVTDFYDALYMASILEIEYGGPADVLWYAPFFLITLAARARNLPITEENDISRRHQHFTPKGVPLLVYAFAFPVIHFSLGLFGRNPPGIEKPREMLILAWLFLLGILSSAQYLWLGNWNRELQKKRQKAEERALLLSKQDALTGLLNRRELDPILDDAISIASEANQRIALLFVDLDGFKLVNDSFGHSKGDAVLQTVAHRIRQCVRDTDSALRYGGDEFVLVLEDISESEYAESIAVRVLMTLAEDLAVDGRPIKLGASIGISLFPEDGETPQALIDRADSMMYKAKAEGGGRYFFASEMSK